MQKIVPFMLQFIEDAFVGVNPKFHITPSKYR